MVNARVKGYVVLVSVFVLGAAAGGGSMFAFAQRRHAALVREDFRALEGRRIGALTRKLALDAEQERRIGAILARDRDDSRALGREMVERCGQPLRDHKAQVDKEIRELLRPDQQARFDSLVEERRERVWMGPGIGGGGRGH